jgi:hypothetical protein
VRDLHFDNDTWRVHHAYANTHAYFPWPRVLIEARLLEHVDWPDRAIRVRQSRDQIKHDPSIRVDPPIYRQVEEQAKSFYVWAAHWVPMHGVPEPNPDFRPPEGARLRSLNHLLEYPVCDLDGEIGRIDDFLVDEEDWQIGFVVLNLNWTIPGKYIMVPVDRIRDIAFEQKTLTLDTVRTDLKDAPEYRGPHLVDATIEEQVRSYFRNAAVPVEVLRKRA